MFKFKEEGRDSNIKKAKEMLTNLINTIPSLVSIDVGVDFSKEERAMDLSIITLFKDINGLNEYAISPTHLKVVEFIKEVTEYSKVVDYES
jgi:hypothetical protein